MTSLGRWRIQMTILTAAGIVAAVAASVAAVACSPGAAAPPGSEPRIPAGGVLSITPSTANVPAASGQEIIDALQATYDAGARGFYAAFRWNELEPSAGTYDMTPLQGALQAVTAVGFTRIFVNIQAINTNRKEVPPDLMGVAWDTPQMQLRFRALLDRVAPLLGANVAYVAIGNEVDAYLGPNNEWTAYGIFFTQARTYLRSLRPGTPVGVATILDGARGSWRTQVLTLNALADIAVYTYYGNGSAFVALQPAAGSQALRDMVTLAAGKPVIVQEFGQSSSTVNGGSEDLQARFLATSLATWSSLGANAIPFFSQFALHDFPPALCDELLTYYGTGPNTPFREYLCYLGLRRQDRSAKPAWDSVRAFGRR